MTNFIEYIQLTARACILMQVFFLKSFPLPITVTNQGAASDRVDQSRKFSFKLSSQSLRMCFPHNLTDARCKCVAPVLLRWVLLSILPGLLGSNSLEKRRIFSRIIFQNQSLNFCLQFANLQTFTLRNSKMTTHSRRCGATWPKWEKRAKIEIYKYLIS